jgi:hypothetical protein
VPDERDAGFIPRQTKAELDSHTDGDFPGYGRWQTNTGGVSRRRPRRSRTAGGRGS